MPKLLKTDYALEYFTVKDAYCNVFQILFQVYYRKSVVYTVLSFWYYYRVFTYSDHLVIMASNVEEDWGVVGNSQRGNHGGGQDLIVNENEEMPEEIAEQSRDTEQENK